MPNWKTHVTEIQISSAINLFLHLCLPGITWAFKCGTQLGKIATEVFSHTDGSFPMQRQLFRIKVSAVQAHITEANHFPALINGIDISLHCAAENDSIASPTFTFWLNDPHDFPRQSGKQWEPAAASFAEALPHNSFFRLLREREREHFCCCRDWMERCAHISASTHNGVI